MQPRAALVERATRVVVEKRRRRPAPRQAPLFQAEHEDRVETARTRPPQVEDSDASGLVALLRPQRLPLERRRDVLAR